MINELCVCENFYSIQGEGPTSGFPAVFLRLAGCVLKCTYCDSVQLWKKGYQTKVDSLIDSWLHGDLIKRLCSGTARLVLTGGDPLIQQDGLTTLLEKLHHMSRMYTPSGDDRYPVVEVETEAVLEPKNTFDDHVDQYNVSPKLSNSGMPEERRLKPDVLRFHAADHRSIFKFVVSNDDDVIEAEETIIKPYAIAPQQIFLMPEGSTSKDLNAKHKWLVETCKVRGYNFTTRLQVLIWEKTVGV